MAGPTKIAGPRVPLEQFAAQLNADAKVIVDFCQKNDHPNRSLDHIEPQNVLPVNAPEHVREVRRRLVEAAMKVIQLANDPDDFLQNFQVQYQQLAALRWLCHFRVLHHIPLKGTISFPLLASSANVPLPQLKSISRMAMLANFLREPNSGEVAHSSTSAAFLTNPALHDWAEIMTNSSAPMAAHNVEATLRFGESKEKNEAAFNCWKNTEKSYFEFIGENEVLTKQFARYENCDEWKGDEYRASGCRLGGSSGHASIALAEAFPALDFIVQDLPDTIQRSKPQPGQLPPAVAGRIDYQHHDFFKPQPLKEIDAILLRMILHDWPDKEAKTIVRNLVPSLKAGGKLIVMDTVLPRPGSSPLLTEARLRVRDLTMMQVHNAKERETEEWAELFKSVDENLRIKSVAQPFGSSRSVLEVTRDEVQQTNGHAVELAAELPGVNKVGRSEAGTTNGRAAWSSMMVF